MADQVFNISKGKIGTLVQNVADGSPAASALIIVVLDDAEVDDTLNNYDDLSTLLAAVGNTEHASFARKSLTAADAVAVTVDDTANDVDFDFGDLTYTAPGAGNAAAKLLVCYDADTATGTDANITPLSHHDFVVTPDGNDVTVTVPGNGFAGAS